MLDRLIPAGLYKGYVFLLVHTYFGKNGKEIHTYRTLASVTQLFGTSSCPPKGHL